MKRLTLIFLALCLVLTMAVPIFSQTHVKIEPVSLSADVGEIFTVNVEMNDANNLRGVSVKIGFDPTILEAQKVTSGGFMSSFGQTFAFSDKDNTEGWAQYDESILGSGDMASGGGTVCKVEFKAIAAGSSALTFLVADLRDYDNMPITTTTENGSVLVGGSAVILHVYAALEGPFDAENGIMRTDVAQRDLIPLSSPYSSAPETVSAVPANIVDWVLLQLRKTTAGATVAEKSCFIQNDGTIIQADGQANITFWGVDDGDYYVVLAHRNHLAVMTADAATLSATPAEIDFSVSASAIYGGQAKLLNSAPPVYGLFAGDGNADGHIDQADVDGVLNNRDAVEYLDFDFNMSGIVTISDIDKPNANGGTSTNVPAN